MFIKWFISNLTFLFISQNELPNISCKKYLQLRQLLIKTGGVAKWQLLLLVLSNNFLKVLLMNCIKQFIDILTIAFICQNAWHICLLSVARNVCKCYLKRSVLQLSVWIFSMHFLKFIYHFISILTRNICKCNRSLMQFV